jgi:ubiquinol-cytochrome c reductase cytochrome b subunit
MRDVNYGWLIRNVHSNAVAFFFIFVYIHIGRGLFFGSYRAPRTSLWVVGVIIFIIMMATAFIGYVLPYGQMSLWGATVICNLFSAIPWIGNDVVQLLWGGFSVSNPTLNRFFSLHFMLPFILAAFVVMHLIALHEHASNNPLGISSGSDRIRFHPYFISKDLVGFFSFFFILSVYVFFFTGSLGHPDNFIMANPLVTPASIVPEFYFLPFYCILRAIPDKLFGVVAMVSALLILIPLSFFSTANLRSLKFKPVLHILFWIFVFNFLLLTWLGAKHIEQPYIIIGQIASMYYFIYFMVLMLLG